MRDIFSNHPDLSMRQHRIIHRGNRLHIDIQIDLALLHADRKQIALIEAGLDGHTLPLLQGANSIGLLVDLKSIVAINTYMKIIESLGGSIGAKDQSALISTDNLHIGLIEKTAIIGRTREAGRDNMVLRDAGMICKIGKCASTAAHAHLIPAIPQSIILQWIIKLQYASCR